MLVRPLLEKFLKEHPEQWFSKTDLVRILKSNSSTVSNSFNRLAVENKQFKKKYDSYTKTVRSITGYSRKVTTERVFYGYFPDEQE